MQAISNEVFLSITDHLHPGEYFRLLRVCRAWNELLFPRAYRRLKLASEDIYPLVRCIYRNPKIATVIRELDVELWTSGGMEEGYYKDIHNVPDYYSSNKEEKSDVRVVEWAVRRICNSQQERAEWMMLLRNIGSKSSGEWAAVLVLSLEAVTDLTLKYAMVSANFIPLLEKVAMREPPFDAKPALQCLERVTVEAEIQEGHMKYSAEEFFPFFRLPMMRLFSAQSLSDDLTDSVYSRPDPRTSSIRELYLNGVGGSLMPNTRGITDCIAACANLEILHYRDVNSGWGNVNHLRFLPAAFYTTLVNQKHSLRELRLNENAREGNYAGFGSLAEFHELRELRIPVRTLLQFGHNDCPTLSLCDILPPNLEFLYLSHFYRKDLDVLMTDLQRLVSQRSEQLLPNLTKLQIWVHDVDVVAKSSGDGFGYIIPVSVQQAFAPFTETCREAGVHFSLDRPEWATMW